MSLPTENFAYQIAKKIMHHPETNDHHVCNPKDIEATLREKFSVAKKTNLFFFKIFECKKQIN